MKVAVLGSGYVGLVSAVGLGLRGHEVLAIDIDPIRVKKIANGEVPFYEPGLTEGLKVCLLAENLKVTDNLEAVLDYEIVLICVQTPPKSDGSIDLSILEKALKQLADIFEKNPGDKIVVVRSTVIPGTTENFVAPIFSSSSTKTEVVFNPEFLREGSALKDFIRPDRIVIGTNSNRAKVLLTQLYSPFNAPLIITTPSTAEISKYTSNTLLATLVSFSNQIARITEKTPNTDIEQVLDILHLDRRFRLPDKDGRASIISYLKAGCGYGGSCLPKDLSALITYAKSLKEEAPLLEAVEKINNEQPLRVVKMAKEAMGGFDKHKVAVLGVAFKGGTDDLRDSPGLAIVNELLKEKAKVVIFDPLVNKQALKSYIEKGAEVVSTFSAALKGATACIIASNALEFAQIDQLNGQNKNLKIVDGRRFLKPQNNWEGRYFAIGRAIKNNT